jgi:uncharacterized membrane protein
MRERSTTVWDSQEDTISYYVCCFILPYKAPVFIHPSVVIFAGAFIGFALARLQYLSFNGVFCKGRQAAPGECYWYTKFPKYKAGLLLHLGGILRKCHSYKFGNGPALTPAAAAILAVYQFVPAIRHHFLLLHRLNGWTIILLVLVGNTGAIMIAPHAFGGDLSTQAGVGTLVIMTTLGLTLAIYNIKRLQVDQHRAWMLRTWFYFGTIITLRFIQITSASIISGMSRYRLAMECAKLDYIMQDRTATLAAYPDCTSFYNGTDPDRLTMVDANISGSGETVAATLGLSFGMAMWLALWLHAIGVEIYLHLTPREAQRLREVSYQKQLEAGFKNPGSAGLTSDRLGDAEPWQPPKSSDENIDAVFYPSPNHKDKSSK